MNNKVDTLSYPSIGGTNKEVTTQEFVNHLKAAGFFAKNTVFAKTFFGYGTNVTINDTGCGKIHLAGAVIEKFGSEERYTIRITTPTTSVDQGKTKAVFVYTNNGVDYLPGWTRYINYEEYAALESRVTALEQRP